MATSSIRPDKGSFYISFRYGGRQFNKSLRISVGDTLKEQHANRKLAEREKAMVETVLDELARGRKTLPEGADLCAFVRSDGRLASKPTLAAPLTLGKMFDAYFGGLPEGAKEKNTLVTERVHERHLVKAFGKSKPVAAIARAELQSYVNARSKAGVGRETVKKELATLRMVWNRAADAPLPYPKLGRGQELAFPKGKEKAKFRSWDEVGAAVLRDRLEGKAAAELWASVFLSVPQVEEFLEFARTRKTRNPFWYPLLAFVAHTGARRSEAIRVRVEDVRFDEGEVTIREKKRDRSKEETTRTVALSPLLERVLREWFAGKHPAATTPSVAPRASRSRPKASASAGTGSCAGASGRSCQGSTSCATRSSRTWPPRG